MKKLLISVAALALVSACSDSGADTDGDGKITSEEAAAELKDGGAMNMKAGQWEVTNKMETFDAPDMPPQMLDAMKTQMGKATTIKTCLSEEDVKNPGADFFGNKDSDECEFSELNRSGNSMKVAMKCQMPQGMAMESKMDGSYSDDSYEMNIDAKMSGLPMGMGEIAMIGTVTGKRIGDCPS